MILSDCVFVPWCQLSLSEQASWASVVVTSLLAVITTYYVLLTRRLALSNESTLKLLTDREKPFICINNPNFFNKLPRARIQDIRDKVFYDRVRFDLNNGGMSLAIIKSVKPTFKTKELSKEQEHQSAMIEKAHENAWVTFSEGLFVAPGQERPYFIGINAELAFWISEMNVEVEYEDLNKNRYRYSLWVTYSDHRREFIPIREKHEHL